MSNRHPDDRMDDILCAQGDDQRRIEQWIASPYNQELAETIVHAWHELKSAYCAEFGEDASISDVMELGDVAEWFRVKVKR